MKNILFFIAFVLSMPLLAQPDWVHDFLNDEALTNAPHSICVSNLVSNEILLDEAADLCITPASTLKLITSATALKVLGKDFRFETKLWVKGIISDSTLKGDLIISGGGDPTLGSSYFFGKNQTEFYNKWVKAVQDYGIDSIDGNIIVDPSIYSDQDVPQTWIWEDLGNYFGAAAQGIALYDNTFKIVFETDSLNGGPSQIIGTEPFIPGLDIQNEVRASDDKRDKAYVYGSPFDNYRIIRGTLPKARTEFKVKASIPDPSTLLAFEFQKILGFKGIEVSGTIIKLNQNLTTPLNPDSIVLNWTSPPLSEIITQLNYESINLIAEHLCKHIGLVLANEGSTQAGIASIKKFWTEKGINTDFLFLADGSGLSRANAISSKTLVQILTAMNNDTINGESYRESLPLTGLQGTQQYYFQHSFLKGKAQAKSGSMTRVRSFAGYMTTQKGTPIAFAILVNNFDCGSFKMASKMEKLMEQFYTNY